MNEETDHEQQFHEPELDEIPPYILDLLDSEGERKRYIAALNVRKEPPESPYSYEERKEHRDYAKKNATKMDGNTKKAREKKSELLGGINLYQTTKKKHTITEEIEIETATRIQHPISTKERSINDAAKLIAQARIRAENKIERRLQEIEEIKKELNDYINRIRECKNCGKITYANLIVNYQDHYCNDQCYWEHTRQQ